MPLQVRKRGEFCHYNESYNKGGFGALSCQLGLTTRPCCERMKETSQFQASSLLKVGLWRSWERASMAWKRSSVRSRPGPPLNQQLTDTLLYSLDLMVDL